MKHYFKKLAIIAIVAVISIQTIAQKKMSIAELKQASQGFIAMGAIDVAISSLSLRQPEMANDPEFYLLMASVYNFKNDFVSSKEMIDKAIELCKSDDCSSQVKEVMAEMMYFKKDYTSAISILENHLQENNPKSPYPWYYSGASKYKLKQYKSALNDLQKAFDLSVDSSDNEIFLWAPQCNEMLALGYLGINDYNSAEKYIKLLIDKRVGDSVQNKKNLAICYYKQKKWDSAIQLFQELIVSAPNDIEIYKNLANLFAEKGDKVKAEQIFTNLLNKLPNSSEAHFEYGLYHLTQGNIDKALAMADKAISLDPLNSKYLMLIVLSLAEKKEYQKAIQYNLKASLIDPSNAFIFYHLGFLYANLKEWEKALEYANKALLVDNKDILALTLLSRVNFEKGQCEESKKFALQANKYSFVNQEGPLGSNYYYIGRCLEINGDNRKSIDFYRIAAALGNSDAKEKLKTLKIPLDSDWNSVVMDYFNKGKEIMISNGNLDEAKEKFEFAKELAPGNYSVLQALVILYWTIKDFDKALTETMNALELYPDDGAFNTYAGIFTYKKGDSDNCFKYLSKAAMIGNQEALDYLYKFGWEYFNNENYKATILFIEEYQKYQELTGEELYYLAVSYHYLDNLKKAQDLYIKSARAGYKKAQNYLDKYGVSW